MGLIGLLPTGIHRVFEDVDQGGAQLVRIDLKFQVIQIFRKFTAQINARGCDPRPDNTGGFFGKVNNAAGRKGQIALLGVV